MTTPSVAHTRKGLLLHIAGAAYSLLALAWFTVPLFGAVPGALVPPMLPPAFLGPGGADILRFLILTCIVYPIPVLCLLRIAAVFLEHRAPSLADPTRVLPIVLGILTTALVAATQLIHLVSFAAGPSYWQTVSWLSWAAFPLSVILNMLSVAFLVATLNRRDPVVREQGEQNSAARTRGGSALAALRRPGIQKRLTLVFLPFVAAIVVIPAAILMHDFDRTASRNAVAGGRAAAERTAGAIRMFAADLPAIRDYLAAEGRRSAESGQPLLSLTFYRREGRTDWYEAEAGTPASRLGRRVQRRPAALAASPRLDAAGDLYEFAAPVAVGGTTVGFAAAEYAREAIEGPSFRVRVKVILIAALSLYAAVLLVSILARTIVQPILLLRASVSAVSRTLGDMVKGKTRISPSLLQYKDRVRTRDEVKLLSEEIRGMTAVVRGIIPYISSSTLAHSERETPRTQKRTFAFLFSDIRDFTSLCEGESPDAVVELLNRCLELQTGIIHANGGDIDKFVGDEIMAVFKGQNREASACRASVEIRSAMAAEKELAKLARRQAVTVGIGINSGPVIFGSVGSHDRMDFTCIGDAVNVAARLESANRRYGTGTLLSEAVHDKVSSAYACREIDLLTVKGRRQPVRIFELMQERDKATDRVADICRVFEEGLAAYRRQKWAVAEKSFSFLVEKFQDEASAVFLRRIALFRLEPPPRAWDGVFNLGVK
jgi:class 3 adenylate cyclase